jgi:hypothetical protein
MDILQTRATNSMVRVSRISASMFWISKQIGAFSTRKKVQLPLHNLNRKSDSERIPDPVE